MIAEDSRGRKETSMKGGTSNNLCTVRLMLWLLAVLVLAGCASRPINAPIAQVDPKSGYRPYLLIPCGRGTSINL
ncbi:MAG: hypothetical protein ACQ9MH_17465 [Nitrospinales bacterium]